MHYFAQTYAKRDIVTLKHSALSFLKLETLHPTTILMLLWNSIKFTLVIFTSVTPQKLCRPYEDKVWKFNLAAGRLCHSKTAKLGRHWTESTTNFFFNKKPCFGFLRRKKAFLYDSPSSFRKYEKPRYFQDWKFQYFGCWIWWEWWKKLFLQNVIVHFPNNSRYCEPCIILSFLFVFKIRD